MAHLPICCCSKIGTDLQIEICGKGYPAQVTKNLFISPQNQRQTSLPTMSTVLNHLRYSTSHEWLESGKSPAAVGITDHAQAGLADIISVDLPAIGSHVAAGQQVAVVESVKASSDIHAPVSGKIVAVNEALESNPDLVNTNPFTEGWIFKIAPSDPKEADNLLDADAYRAHIA